MADHDSGGKAAVQRHGRCAKSCYNREERRIERRERRRGRRACEEGRAEARGG